MVRAIFLQLIALLLLATGSWSNSTAVEPQDKTTVYIRSWDSRRGRWEKLKVDFFYYYIY